MRARFNLFTALVLIQYASAAQPGTTVDIRLDSTPSFSSIRSGSHTVTLAYSWGRGPTYSELGEWVDNANVLRNRDFENDKERNFGLQTGLEYKLNRRLSARAEIGYQRSETRFFRPYSPYWIYDRGGLVTLDLYFMDRYRRNLSTLAIGASYRIIGPLAIGIDIRQELLVSSSTWNLERKQFGPNLYPYWEEPQHTFHAWRYEGIEIVPRIGLATRFAELSLGFRVWRWERVDRLIFDMLTYSEFSDRNYRRSTEAMRYLTARVKVPLGGRVSGGEKRGWF